MLGLIGKKLGMTQIFVDGAMIPVTVVEAGPCGVVSTNSEKSGYTYVQLGLLQESKIDKQTPKSFF